MPLILAKYPVCLLGPAAEYYHSEPLNLPRVDTDHRVRNGYNQRLQRVWNIWVESCWHWIESHWPEHMLYGGWASFCEHRGVGERNVRLMSTVDATSPERLLYTQCSMVEHKPFSGGDRRTHSLVLWGLPPPGMTFTLPPLTFKLWALTLPTWLLFICMITLLQHREHVW